MIAIRHRPSSALRGKPEHGSPDPLLSLQAQSYGESRFFVEEERR
jgi:hypothetical protein